MSRRLFMPPLDRNPTFPIERACIDKVEINIEGFSLRGANALEALHSYIHEAGLPVNESEQRIFHSTPVRRLRGKSFTSIAVGEGGQRLVFGGKLDSYCSNSSNVRFSLDCKMNVTRAIQAQCLFGRLHTRRPRRRKAYSLLLSPPEKVWHDEHALLKADNILLGHDMRFAYAMAQAPSGHFEELLTNIEYAISQPLLAVSEQNNVPVETSSSYTLKGIEVYWEFTTPHPVSTVDLLAPKLQSVVNQSRTNAYPIKLLGTTRVQQSRSIQLDLGSKILLRIYAKTNKRIRFEISWGRDAIAQQVGRRSEIDRVRLMEVIDWLVSRSSERLTELFYEMSPPLYGTLEVATTDDLLRAIGAAHPDPVICAVILDGLRHYDRIVPEGSQPLLDAVRRLKRKGVLRVIRRHQGWYGITPSYAEALDALRVSRRYWILCGTAANDRVPP